MKRLYTLVLTIMVGLALLLASCSARPGNIHVVEGGDIPPATEIPMEPLVYHADLTHDGKDEKIIVDLSQLKTEDQNANVSVFDSGDKLLWSGDASIIHAGNNGIYLYKENDYTYLLTWCPWAGQGSVGLSYEIFSLSNNGDVLSYRKGEGTFTLDNEMSAGPNGRRSEANLFIQEVNRYLEQSMLLVAATTEGAYFSTPDNLVVRLAQEF